MPPAKRRNPTETQAKIARLKALTKRIEVETRTAEADAEAAELELERAKEKRALELAQNDRHKVYVFDSDVTDGSVKKCIQQLTTWARQDPACPIEIQINSPGGAINAGFALIDFIRDLRTKGHEVTMVALGMAASMAGVILQAADVRVMGANCFLLLHEGSLGAIGDFGEVKDRVKLMEMYHERILALFEERAKPINEKTTKTFIRNRWARSDWWIPSEDALKLGLVDEVR